MKQQEVLKKIGGIISELSEQYEYLKSEENHLNSLELELFVANAHFLSDHAEVLRKICSALPAQQQPIVATGHQPVIEEDRPSLIPQQPSYIINDIKEQADLPLDIPAAPVFNPELTMQADEHTHSLTNVQDDHRELKPAEYKIEPEIMPVSDVLEPQPESDPILPSVPEPEIPEPVAQAPVTTIDLGEKKDTYDYIRQAPEPVVEHSFSIGSHAGDERVAPAMVEAVAAQKPEEPVAAIPQPAIPPVVTQSEPEAKTEQPVQTLNQRLFAQLHGGAAAPATTAPKPVTDLKSAISLNDKLMFVRDLFNGYNLAYSEAIELLNRCKNFDEADRLLKSNYVTRNNWQSKQATADKFYAVLHRRFAE